jgi:hypothetical protein
MVGVTHPPFPPVLTAQLGMMVVTLTRTCQDELDHFGFGSRGAWPEADATLLPHGASNRTAGSMIASSGGSRCGARENRSMNAMLIAQQLLKSFDCGGKAEVCRSSLVEARRKPKIIRARLQALHHTRGLCVSTARSTGVNKISLKHQGRGPTHGSPTSKITPSPAWAEGTALTLKHQEFIPSSKV